MPTALHSQTLLTLTWDGQTLPAKYGYPMKLRMPTKLGYKNPKHIQAIFVTNTYPGGYWEDQGYNWSAAAERRLCCPETRHTATFVDVGSRTNTFYKASARC
jgi:DMSO/TMAO reductase YedYZ molybdopterin-dependent catalytic subunit